MIEIPFLKIHGTKNSFLVVNRATFPLPRDARYISSLCSKATGIGVDGIMIVGEAHADGIEVEMLNPDGSRMGMCGNGARAVVRGVLSVGGVREFSGKLIVQGRTIEVATSDGGENVSVNLGVVSFDPASLPLRSTRSWINHELDSPFGKLGVTAVSVGNPHAVIFTELKPESYQALGKWLEVHPDFPERVNVEIVKVLDRRSLSVFVWERGVGVTLASGTGAVVSVAAAQKLGLIDSGVINVELPGGSLAVEVLANQEGVLTGPTAVIAKGVLYVD